MKRRTALYLKQNPIEKIRIKSVRRVAMCTTVFFPAVEFDYSIIETHQTFESNF